MTAKELYQLLEVHDSVMNYVCGYVQLARDIDLTEEDDYDDLKMCVMGALLSIHNKG